MSTLLLLGVIAALLPASAAGADEPVITPIYAIQGAAHVSPAEGTLVTTEGVVTAVAFNGYYIQDPVGDGDPATSDAMFVFQFGGLPAVGDHLKLTDTDTENVGGGCSTGNLYTTQMSFPDTVELEPTTMPVPVVIGSSGRVPPNVVTISDAAASTEGQINLQPSFCPGGGDSKTFDPGNEGLDFYESLEGMLVTIEDPVAISGTRTFSSFSSEMFTLPNNGANAAPADVRTARGGINLAADADGYGDTNPERVQVQFDPTISGGATVPNITVGDQLDDVTGVVGYSFGNFEVIATDQVTFTAGGLETETTALTPKKREVAVASYNVLNLSPVSYTHLTLPTNA